MNRTVASSLVSPIVGSPQRPSTRDDGIAHGGTVKRFDELEGLRGIAALLVVFYHLPSWHPQIHALPFVDNGALMVQLFFVLSGFVISGAYRGRLQSLDAVWRFQFLRFGRLYPVHLVFLGFFLVAELLKLYLATRYGIQSNNTRPFVENSWTAFAEHLVLLQPFLGNALTFNSPAWSIGIEFYIYLLYALLLVYLPKQFNLIAAVLSMSAICILGVADLDGSIWILRGISGFFLGALVHEFAVRRPGRTIPHLMPIALAAMVLFLCADLSHWTALLIYPITAALIYAIATGSDDACRRFLRSSPMAWLGRISYSVYMCHAAVIWTASQVVRFMFKVPGAMSARGHVDAQMSLASALLACAVCVACTLLLGTVVCRLVEEPLRLASRRWAADHLGST